MKEQSLHKVEVRFGLSMPNNRYNNLLLVHIDGVELILIFWFQILSYVPLLQQGTTAEFGSSHHHTAINIT